MSSIDWLLELFNWRIKKFLAVGYLRITFLLSVLSICVYLGIYEYGVSRPLDLTMDQKIGRGLGGLLGGIFLILIIRVITEFLIAIFYIEDHLVQIKNGNNENLEHARPTDF